MTSKVVLPAISRAVVVPASDNPGDDDDGNEPSPPPQCLGPRRSVLGAAFEVDQDIGSALSNSAEQIKVGEVGMILRSDKSWKYAKLLRRTDSEMEFIVDTQGTREIVLKAYYGKCIRRIPPTEEGELDDGNEPGAASEFLLTLQQSKKENWMLKKGIGLLGLLYLITLGVLLTMHLTYPKYPTQAPTLDPTQSPTANPTESPTANPTESPTANPTESPTESPTEAPTLPTPRPTQAPTLPTLSPTQAPVTVDWDWNLSAGYPSCKKEGGVVSIAPGSGDAIKGVQVATCTPVGAGTTSFYCQVKTSASTGITLQTHLPNGASGLIVKGGCSEAIAGFPDFGKCCFRY